MNILLCFNDNFATLARTLIISLMCHHRHLRFYVGYINLSEANRRDLKELVEGKCPKGDWPWDKGDYHKFAPERSIEFVKFTPPPDLRVLGSLSLDTWTRCFIWEQLPIDRLLYLDADIVVNGNIEQFYHDDMGDNLLKACPDYVCYGSGYGNLSWTKNLLRLQEEHGYQNVFGHYCNAGVVLFNLAKMREEGLSAQQFMDYCKKLTKPLRMNDQDFINLFFDGRIKLANPYRYNCEMSPASFMRPRDFSDFAEIDMREAPYPKTTARDGQPAASGVKFDPKQILVFHYSGAKPLQKNYRHRFANVFWRYRLMDPQEHSKHIWTRVLQSCWGHIRRLIPDYPLAFLRIRGRQLPASVQSVPTVAQNSPSSAQKSQDAT